MPCSACSLTAETALELFIPVIMANIIDVGVPAGDINMLLQGHVYVEYAPHFRYLPAGYARTSARVASGLGAINARGGVSQDSDASLGNLDNYDASLAWSLHDHRHHVDSKTRRR